MQLPKQICVLDIETYGIKRTHPEQTRLAFTGLKTYILNSGRYRPLKHRVFSPEQSTGLEDFLRAFEHVIVGHRLVARAPRRKTANSVYWRIVLAHD